MHHFRQTSHAPSLGPGDPFLLSLNQTKSARVTTSVPRPGGIYPFTSLFFFEGNRFKEKKKKKNPRMGRNVFSNIPSGPCVYGRFTRAQHPPSASRPSQKPRPKHLHCRGPNHLTAFAFPGLIAPQNRFPEVRLLVQAVCKLRPLRAGTHLPPPRGAAPGTPDPPRLRTPDASKDLTSQLWNSQNRRSTPSRRCGDPE